MHKQLTSEQRYTIACLLKENVSIRKIAAMIGVAPRNEGDSKKRAAEDHYHGQRDRIL
ncbi:helix-turn-helix domain-containing protein [Porphyromonas gulae]|uniref:helix-turn-helix domain-containing protein n=1 Tax=Porphyromonas gulae TaxID=111105 RepID=UPI000375564B|nr:helix-turn-helix domain-containing protein [Porphyromonas gulae]